MLRKKDLKIGRIWHEYVWQEDDIFLISSKDGFDVSIQNIYEWRPNRPLDFIILTLDFQKVIRVKGEISGG